MDLLQLRYFQAVAIHQHISQAATELHVSQPAISMAIHKLEEELGTQLFDRIGRNIEINEYGEAFLARVNNIIIELENAKKEIDDLSNINRETIKIALSSPQYLYEINSFIKDHPKIKWKQSVGSLEYLRSLLFGGGVEIVISTPGFNDSKLDSLLLYQDTFMVAMHKNNHLSNRKSMTLKEIASENMIALHKGLSFRDETDNLFFEAGLKPHIIMECDHELRRSLINSNVGIMISSKSAKLRNIYKDDIIYLPISDVKRGRNIVMNWRKDLYISSNLKKFINYIEEVYKNYKLKSNDIKE